MNTKLTIVLIAIVSIVILLYYSSSLFPTEKAEEGFVNTTLQIHFCPLTAPVVQTASGNTDCCEGDLLDGKCKGNVICTQSPSHDSIPTCTEYWRKYFSKKSSDVCPPGMTNYFEDIKSTSKPKGCSESPTLTDGTGPSDSSAPKCRVYNTPDDNKSKPDSCYVEKLKGKIRCPILSDAASTEIRIANGYGNKFAFFYCIYTSNVGIPSFCGDDKTYSSYLDVVAPNWRTSQWASQTLESMCSNFIEARNRNSREAQNRRLEDERRKREQTEKELRDAQERNAKLQSQWQAALNDAKSCKR
jgi:hypothetical protein